MLQWGQCLHLKRLDLSHNDMVGVSAQCLLRQVERHTPRTGPLKRYADTDDEDEGHHHRPRSRGPSPAANRPGFRRPGVSAFASAAGSTAGADGGKKHGHGHHDERHVHMIAPPKTSELMRRASKSLGGVEVGRSGALGNVLAAARKAATAKGAPADAHTSGAHTSRAGSVAGYSSAGPGLASAFALSAGNTEAGNVSESEGSTAHQQGGGNSHWVQVITLGCRLDASQGAAPAVRRSSVAGVGAMSSSGGPEPSRRSTANGSSSGSTPPQGAAAEAAAGSGEAGEAGAAGAGQQRRRRGGEHGSHDDPEEKLQHGQHAQQHHHQGEGVPHHMIMNPKLQRYDLDLSQTRPDHYYAQLLVEHEMEARRKGMSAWKTVIHDTHIYRWVVAR